MKKKQKEQVEKPKPKPLKLEYLRAIEKNLFLHCIQPNDTEENAKRFNPYEMPTEVLNRMVYVLVQLLERYNSHLKVRKKAEKKLKGKTGLERSILEATFMMEQWVSGPKASKQKVKQTAKDLEKLARKLREE